MDVRLYLLGLLDPSLGLHSQRHDRTGFIGATGSAGLPDDRMDSNVSANVTKSGGYFDFLFLSPYPTWHLVVFGFLASSVGLVTIGGNLVVILSFVVVPSIRQPTNYFIASLAVSDLLIGVVSMPFYTVYLLFGEVWPLGENLCDLWLSMDYTLCMCSIYTVFCITVDRFCSVKLPAKYRKWRTGKKVGVAICLTWTIPILVFFTSIFGWQHFVGKRTVPPLKCYVQYMEDALFNSLLQIGYFWITLAAMITLYIGIYKVALDLHKRSAEKRDKNMACLVSMAGKTVSQIGTVITMGYRTNEQTPPQYPRFETPDYYDVVYNNNPREARVDLKTIPEGSERENQSETYYNALRPNNLSTARFSTFGKLDDASHPSAALAAVVVDQSIIDDRPQHKLNSGRDDQSPTSNAKASPTPPSSTAIFHPLGEIFVGNVPLVASGNSPDDDDNKDYFKDSDDKENLLSPIKSARDELSGRPCIVITNEAAETMDADIDRELDPVTVVVTAVVSESDCYGMKSRCCYSSQYNFQGSMCRFYPVVRPHSSTEIFVRPMTEELKAEVLGFGRPVVRKSLQNQLDVCRAVACSRQPAREEEGNSLSYRKARHDYGSFGEVAGRTRVVARLSTVNLNSLTSAYDDDQKRDLIEHYLSGVDVIGGRSSDSADDSQRTDAGAGSARNSTCSLDARSLQVSEAISGMRQVQNDSSPCCQCTGKEFTSLGSEKVADVRKEDVEASTAAGFFHFMNFPNPPSLHILSPLKHHISSAYSGLNFPHIFGLMSSSGSESPREKAEGFFNIPTRNEFEPQADKRKKSASSTLTRSEEVGDASSEKSRFSGYLDFLRPASSFLTRLFDRSLSDDGSKSVVIENRQANEDEEDLDQGPVSSCQREQTSNDSARIGNPSAGKGNLNLSSRIMDAIRSRSPSTGGRSSQPEPGNSDDDDDSCSSSNGDSIKALKNFGQSGIAFSTLPVRRMRSLSPSSQNNAGIKPRDDDLPSRCPSQHLSPTSSGEVGTKCRSLASSEKSLVHPTSGDQCPSYQQQQQQQEHNNNSSRDDEGQHQLFHLQSHYQQRQLQELHEQKQQQRLASQHSRYKNRTRKALKTITIILGAFVTCWTPWHVLSMIMGFCSTEPEGCVSPTLYSISYWLCYLNSPINPFCYAFANQQFKQAFLRIMKFDWRKS